MITISIVGKEQFDESSGEFIYSPDTVLNLEHSLISISKWEAKWQKPFLSKTQQKTSEETLDYVRCMTLNKNVDENVYTLLTDVEIERIHQYIESSMTATRFSNINRNSGSSSETTTSELIYYWMIALNIPFECEKWHLNRLLTLVEVCNVKNGPVRKMSKSEIMNNNRALNEQRKKQLKTKG